MARQEQRSHKRDQKRAELLHIQNQAAVFMNQISYWADLGREITADSRFKLRQLIASQTDTKIKNALLQWGKKWNIV